MTTWSDMTNSKEMRMFCHRWGVPTVYVACLCIGSCYVEAPLFIPVPSQHAGGLVIVVIASRSNGGGIFCGQNLIGYSSQCTFLRC